MCGEIERWAAEQGLGPLIGLDEAGRGPLAGPVTAAACALPWPCPIDGLNDSKQLSEARREALFDEIVEHAIAFGLVFVEPDVIDELNILHASLLGMAHAREQLVERAPQLATAVALIDGNQRAPLPPDVDQRTIVKGDARSLNIAAASILAKVGRDRYMVAADAEYPVYGFAKHKGYPTRAHQLALNAHGPCPIHRRSFRLEFPGLDGGSDAG
ncbi:MAG: ribonuclease HII [Deltaproteobacteria bacterium]|nr:MAG: ribonuclease HII [Deltaproteobacteria bacterium]